MGKRMGVGTSGALVRAALGCATLGYATLACGAQQTPAPTAGASPGVSTLITPAVSPEIVAPVSELKPQQIQGMQRRLGDWPQLSAYREQNRKLGPPQPGQQRVVFLGDSLTDNWGRRAGKFFPDMPWVNRGISGQTTPQMLLRFQQDVLSLQPEAFVLLAGCNDVAGNTGAETPEMIQNNIRSMVALAKEAHVRVVLSSLTPVGAFSWRPGVDPRAEIAGLNTWLRSFAAEQHVGFIDYFTPMATPEGSMKPGLSSDGVHPTDAGYAIMEPLARKAVLEALARPRP